MILFCLSIVALSPIRPMPTLFFLKSYVLLMLYIVFFNFIGITKNFIFPLPLSRFIDFLYPFSHIFDKLPPALVFRTSQKLSLWQHWKRDQILLDFYHPQMKSSEILSDLVDRIILNIP